MSATYTTTKLIEATTNATHVGVRFDPKKNTFNKVRFKAANIAYSVGTIGISSAVGTAVGKWCYDYLTDFDDGIDEIKRQRYIAKQRKLIALEEAQRALEEGEDEEETTNVFDEQDDISENEEE